MTRIILINRCLKKQLLEEAINISMQWNFAEDRMIHSRMHEVLNDIMLEVKEDLIGNIPSTQYFQYPISSSRIGNATIFMILNGTILIVEKY